jgi:hydroxymethylglutaryl-CoA lyase
MSQPIEICEVGPRDGLQGLPDFVPTARKVRLVEDLIGAGLRAVEVASFVAPRAIPQMRDGRELVAALAKPAGVTFAAFVPNARGLAAALELGIDWITAATYASEEFSRRNVNCTVAEANERIREMVRAARGTASKVRGYVSCAVECPFLGPVAPARVADLAEELCEAGCEQVFLADTIGRGTPTTVARLADAVLSRIPAERLGIHFHDTYGQGLANALTCLDRGIRRFDTSVAGLGGCPAAKVRLGVDRSGLASEGGERSCETYEGAAGNVATEDLLVALEGRGEAPPVDLERVARIGAKLCRDLGIRNDSKAGRALAAKATEEPH